MVIKSEPRDVQWFSKMNKIDGSVEKCTMQRFQINSLKKRI